MKFSTSLAVASALLPLLISASPNPNFKRDAVPGEDLAVWGLKKKRGAAPGEDLAVWGLKKEREAAPGDDLAVWGLKKARSATSTED